jgi:hypothetical protein
MKKSKDIIPSSSKIVNIESYKDDEGNIIVKNESGYFSLPYYITSSIFLDIDEYNRFIKVVEKLVRQSDYYSTYIATLKLDYGFNYCMFLGNIEDSENKIDIEMHHAILTLYDVVSIITNHLLYHNEKISTFKVAKIVIEEHFQHHICVIMLCKTVHELVHKGKVFINIKQCIGDLETFLKTYKDGITQDMANGINKYLELCKNYDSTDNGFLGVDTIKSWNKKSLEENKVLEFK